MDLKHCPNCGGTLKRGYLIGKQNQIHWSASEKGMTIFHGVPLIRLEKGHWRRWQSWFYAPSISSERCLECKLVIFSYNNDAKENPRKERWASIILGGFLIAVSIVVGGIALWDWSPQPPVPFFLRIILGLFSLILILAGAMLLTHAVRSLQPNNANPADDKKRRR